MFPDDDSATEGEPTPVDGAPEPVEPDPAPEPDPEPATEADSGGRAPRIELEPDLMAVINEIVTGDAPLEDGEKATPHVLAGRIDAKRNNGRSVSPGAVSAALDRWVEYGFVNLDDSPKAFKEYTEEGCDEGLSALKAKYRDQKKAARRAAKEAEKAEAASASSPGDNAPF